ncbi:MAG: DNA polymerase [bacterium]|nr:DNA polymerase [bacterium]
MKSNSKNKRLILLDSHAILHRAYHALPDFSSPKGEPTGALYGLSTMIMKIIEDFQPNYVVATFDLPEATYRHEAYKEYKAGRKKMDDALSVQISRSRDVFEAFSIPIYDKPGFEADDMLGTIVECMKKNKELDIIIASGDMDTMQLVDKKKVQVYTLRKGIKDTILYDEDAVNERYGFGPEHISDFKGLRGDPSDNIIGIKGIGEKTATILIQKFGTIENMYKALKKDKEKFQKEAGVTPRIVELIAEGEEEALFSKMLATIRRDAEIDFKVPDHDWKDDVDVKKVQNLFQELGFRSLQVRLTEILGKTDAFGLPVEASAQAGATAPKEEIDPVKLHETALALWIIDSNIGNPELEDILRFARTDSFSQARETIFAELDKRNLKHVYLDIELPLVPILSEMHTRGIKIDTKYLKDLSVEYHEKLEKIQADIWKMAGEEFNINSPKQLGEVLFTKMGLTAKGMKKTAGGAQSTRESELQKMADLHPIIECILQYRELQKLLSTYIDSIPNLVEEDERLHTTFVQTGAVTGRMASHNPNLQNIPIKTEQGRKIRKAFVAEKGFKLVAFDHSQIELRLAAILSGDEKLVNIFKSGRDVHTEVASRVFKVPAEKVDKEMRRKAKIINFGILYGMGVNALKANLGSTREEAQMFYNEYFATFTGLADYLNQVKAETERKGYTETLFGRRRNFEDIKSRMPHIKAQAERMAINAPIQGTSADMIKLAMIRIDAFLKEKGVEKDVRMLLQVHDELIFEVKDSLIDGLLNEIQNIMQTLLTEDQAKGVPIKSNRAVGKTWGDMESM